MTGAEFKVIALGVLLLVGVPAIFLTDQDDDDSETNAFSHCFVFVLLSLAVFVAYVVMVWDDRAHIGFIFGHALIYAIGAALHAALVLITAWVLRLFRETRQPMSLQAHMVAYIVVGVFWGDLLRGEQSVVRRMLVDMIG